MICPSCQAENEPEASSCSGCGALLDSVVTVAQSGPTPVPASTSHVITLDLRPGVVFHARYEVLEPIGRGGMGMVFKAHDRVLDETVAIKVLRPDVAQDPRMAERFKSEIKLARRVRHRNVCSIHDYGSDQGLFFISMEMIEGVDLKRTLQEKGLRHDEAFDIAIQVAEGLQAVHDAGIVHRDLKTPNIMIDATGMPRLMDFGVAKRLGDGTLTASGQVVGTPEYMSPEQAQGRKVDFRSDVYALGVVVYEIFTGKLPFKGDTPISTILMHINDPPPLDAPAAARLPPGVREVLRRALAKDPDQRYATVREMAEALRATRSHGQHAVGPATHALPASTVKAPPRARSARAHRALQPWLLVLPLIAVGGGVALLQLRGSDQPPAPDAPAPSPASPSGQPPATVAAASPPSAAANAEPPPPPSSLAPAARPSPRPVGAAPTLRQPPAGVPTVEGRRPEVLASPAPLPKATAAPPPTTLPAPSPRSPPPEEGEPRTAGLLQVVVRPWGEVSVDGRVVGTTPLDRIGLSPGAHRVRVRHPGYEPWEREVTIRSGQVEKVTVDFLARGVPKR